MKKLAVLILATLLSLPISGLAGDAPIAVSTPEDLMAIADNPTASYILTDDIDMEGVAWKPIEFYGTLDGAGHTIYNLHIVQVGDKKGRTRDGNLKKYDTYFASLFSVVRDAEIKDLHLLNLCIDVTADGFNCFAAGIAGLAEYTTITGCSVTGRITLYQNYYMCGVAGIAGSGSGTIANCSADVELVIVDTNRSLKCEEFLGGIAGAGYFDIENCTVKLDGYASVHGYVHNGGVLGMYKIYMSDERDHKGYVRGCTVDARITFFEHNSDRRAYCKDIIGEKLNKYLQPENNTVLSFESTETRDYKTVLLPPTCAEGSYTVTVVPPTATAFGYTLYTCPESGYSYTDHYVRPTAP
ncbi:MAG TPA: hypothetical protein PKU80_04915 [Candidatus Limiplasma sp.]|nr:hypothetical protein [Candidatus Limiplasma sp.]HRX09239.1 hypothetical protein [Candidatus Limiplasma sp.]